MPSPKFIISGGGTGGHIFPAIAIANALKKKLPDCHILFVGANGRMEMEKVPAAGYKIEGLNIAGLQRSLTIKNVSFPFKLISSLLKAREIVAHFKPDTVVGVGGYASGPLLYAATSMGIPALVQEQNSYPGITNKLLAKRASKICVAYEGMDRFFPKEKIIITGNPVRQDITKLDGKRQRGIEHFNLDPDKKTLLIIGGSLGARTINESIAKGLEEFKKHNIQIIWQTGKSFADKGEQLAKSDRFGGGWIGTFITKMDLAYAAADMVVSRAGALSVSELCLIGKAVILVPSPNVSEDHQTKNAMALVSRNAALLVKDNEAAEKLVDAAADLIQDTAKLQALESKIAQLAFFDSAEIIANEVIALCGK